MTISSNVQLIWTLQDRDLDDEELEVLVQNLSRQALDIAEDVSRVRSKPDSIQTGELTPKGESSKAGVLNLEINLENITKFATWLHERLTGKMTEAVIEYGVTKVSFKVNNQQELAKTLKDAEQFIAAIKALENTHV